jgi:RNA polymerase sigma-70 factor (ECF subfamily)
MRYVSVCPNILLAHCKMNDSEVVKAVQAGDYQSFGALVDRYRDLVCHLCYRMTGNIPDAEDLAHDAFVEAYLKIHQLRDPERFLPWLRTLTLNLCRMWYREQRDQRMDEPVDQRTLEQAQDRFSFFSLERSPTDHEDDFAYARMAYGLSRLSVPHRMALVLHYWEGLSYEEIAKFLEVPIGTVMSRLHRARNALKQLMEAMIDEEIPMIPDETFQQEVEAEIAMLLEIFGENPDAMTRLSLILKNSPERLVQIVRQAEDEVTLDRLALLLWRLKNPVIEIVLESVFASDADPQVRATAILTRWIARFTRYRPGPAHEVHFLLDRLIASPAEPKAKAELLIELLEASKKGPSVLLLICVLLCYSDVAFSLLMEHFWSVPSAEELYQHSHILHALCRMGTRFGEALLEPLSGGNIRQQTLALAGLEELAGAMRLPQLEQASSEELAVAARFTEGIAPPLEEHRDPVILKTIVDRVAAFLTHHRADMRDPSIRILGLMQAHTYLHQIKACARHEEPSTRMAAILALGEMDDPSCAQALMEAAQSGDLAERHTAIEVLGRLQAQEAQGVLIELINDANSRIRQAAVAALGDIGSEKGRAKLRELVRSRDRAVAKAAARALYTKHRRRQPSETARKRLHRIRGEASPVFEVSTEMAIRALPEIRPYEEGELTRIIARVCRDYSTTRRRLVMDGRHSLMNRAGGIYEITELGKAVWRVEHFIKERYLQE